MKLVITNLQQSDGRFKAVWIDHKISREYVGKGKTAEAALVSLVDIIKTERKLRQLAS